MLGEFYQQIQVIMTFLGFYDGACDGVWGPKCIAAKRKWEFDDSFEPAVPSNGLPFTGRDRLPKGLIYMHRGLHIKCLKMTKEDIEKILSEKGELITCAHLDKHFSVPEPEAKPTAIVADVPAPKVSSLVETPIDVKPEPEPTGVDPEPEEEEDEEVVEEVVEDKTQQQPQKSNWTQQRKK